MTGSAGHGDEADGREAKAREAKGHDAQDRTEGLRFDVAVAGDADDARFQLAAATRRVIDQLARSTTDSEAFGIAHDLVARAAEVIGTGSQRVYGEAAEASLSGHQAHAFVPYSPFVGGLNPLAPPIALRVESNQGPGATAVVFGSVTYGAPYEGPPGCVHGGFIAGGFDEVLGFTQSMSGSPGMTARLSVSYRSPTPLGKPLEYRGQIDRIEGRKIYVSATLSDGETGGLCAEAEGLFVSMKADVFDRLIAARRQRDVPEAAV